MLMLPALSDGDHFTFSNKKQPFKPSIHMPKEAARIWLQVEDVRVERLHDISESDAINEGCCLYGPFGEYRGSIHPNGGIWESINGRESWLSNPWVWVVSFKVLSTTGRPELQ